MRKFARTAAIAVAVALAATVGGCRDFDRHLAEMGLLHVEQSPAASPVRTVRVVRPPKHSRPKSVVRRVAKPEVVEAGAKIRQFCGQRHVRFQSGRLQENAQEKARNDVLCGQS